MVETETTWLTTNMLIALAAGGGAAILMLIAEGLHFLRRRRLSTLAFGPRRRAANWTAVVPTLRVLSVFGLIWGLTLLLLIPPKVHRAHQLQPHEYRHVILVLDVSPSMRLEDAGQARKQARMARASAVMESFFKRVPIEQYKMTVIAFYTDAKPVVEEASDLEVVRNILSDLPMHHAFKTGETKMFSGLELAAETARPWQPRSTTVILLSDGDTVPAVGMPKMPASVGHVVVVGIGDARQGTFIDGHQSRQDISTLRQVATRLGGTYHNGNEHHLPTALLQEITQTTEEGAFEALTLREYALAAVGFGALALALLPLLLHYFGTSWQPGVPTGTSKQDLPHASSSTGQTSVSKWAESRPQPREHEMAQKYVLSRK